MNPPCRFGMESSASLTCASGKVWCSRTDEVQRAGAGHVGHVLGLPGGEPQAAQHAALRAHHREQVEPGALHHAADVDQHAAATEGVDGLEHGFGRRAGSEGVDGDVDALTVGALAHPVGQVCRAGGQHVDPAGSDGLDVVEQVGVAAGAEDAGHAEAQRDEAGAEAEGAGDAVDEDGAAGSGIRLAQAENAVPR